MKRRQNSDWEEIRDPDSVPRNIEHEPEEKTLPDGERPDDDWAWRRPERDYSHYEQLREPEQKEAEAYGRRSHEVLSSEELYRRAQQAKAERLAEPLEPQFYDSRRRRGLIWRSVITVVLVAVTAILLLAIKNQLDLREQLLQQSKQQEQLQSADQTQPQGNVQTAAGSSGETQPEVSIQIIGSWADRYTEPSASDEAAPAETASASAEVTAAP